VMRVSAVVCVSYDMICSELGQKVRQNKNATVIKL
jgi:hypothetical protein